MSPCEVPQDQFEVLPECLSQSQGLERPPLHLVSGQPWSTGKRRDVQAWGRGPSLASQRSLCLSSEYLSGNSSEFRVPVFLYLFTMLTVQNCCVFCNKTTPFKKRRFVQMCPFTINVPSPSGRQEGDRRALGPEGWGPLVGAQGDGGSF